MEEKIDGERGVCPKCGSVVFYNGTEFRICKCMRDAIKEGEK